MKNALIMLLLCVSTVVGATTYYIDPSGLDSNSGAAGTPWKTLAYACSKATASGDIIHINAGTYIETNQCVLAAGVSIEGVGVNSIIKSRYNATGGLNSAFIQLSGGTNNGQHISGIYLDGDNLTGNNAILVYNRSNVSIYNSTIINFSTQGVRFSGSSNNTGNSIYNCTIQNSGGYGTDECGNLSLSYNTGILVYGNTINQDKRSSGNTGLGIQGEDNLYAAKIYNNNIRGTERTVSGNWSFAIEFWNGQKLCGYGMEIYGNTIVGEVDFGAGVTKGSYAYGVDFHNNTVGYAVSGIPSDMNTGRIGLQFEENVSDVIIRNNTFKNLDRQLYFCSNGTAGDFRNIWVYHNIFQNAYYNYISQTTSAGYSAHGAAILFGGATFTIARNIYIWNNTMTALAGREAETGIFLPTTGDCDEVYVQNNIIQGFKGSAISAEAQSGGGTLNTLVIQKNVLYNNGNSNNLLTTGFTPTNVTNDGGIKSDPLFVSTTDFHLQTLSPASDKGMLLSGLTVDYAGTPKKNPPSIGAYENSSVATLPLPPVPVYQNSVVENATPSLLGMTYDQSLANVVPAPSDFIVRVNSVARTVSTVAISGSKVQLTLSSGIKYGEIVTVAYTKPAANPLQTSTGGVATTISAQVVINNLINPAKDASPVTIAMTISPKYIHNVANILLTYSSTPTIAMSPQILRISDLYGKLYVEKLLVLGVTNIKLPLSLKSGIYFVKIIGYGLEQASQKMKVY